MSSNLHIFEQWVNGDNGALNGIPVQKQARFRELREVLDEFFRNNQILQYELGIAITGEQNRLMQSCNDAIEHLDIPALKRGLEARADYDTELHELARLFFTALPTDELGNKYDNKLADGINSELGQALDAYSADLSKCDNVLQAVMNASWNERQGEFVYTLIKDWQAMPTETEVCEILLLSKLFWLSQFFGSLEQQRTNSVLLAKAKRNSNAAIARAISIPDPEKVDRMIKKYQILDDTAVTVNDRYKQLAMPMQTARAQEKLFSEQNPKPEYAYVGYLLSHQHALAEFFAELLQTFLDLVNYYAYALATKDYNKNPDTAINVYLFKLRLTSNFLEQYDYAITPPYDKLKHLHVTDDLIRCVLYEDPKEFKKRMKTGQ